MNNNCTYIQGIYPNCVLSRFLHSEKNEQTLLIYTFCLIAGPLSH